jgi:hypothetical protein
MRRRNWAAFLAVLCLPSLTSHAGDTKTEQAHRQITEILTEFNGILREYERDLKYFQRVPEFKQLFDLRNELVNQVARMNKLSGSGPGAGPAVFELAREMDRTARKLDSATGQLEKRAEAVAHKEDRAVAERMKTHADTMVKSVDRLAALFR